VLTDAAFRATDDAVYVNGEGADALFGLHGVKGARVADALAPLLSPLGASSLCKRAVGRVSPRTATLASVADWLDRPLADPESFAQRHPFFTDSSVVAAMTDESTVAARVRKQHDYVAARVERSPDGRFAEQVEFGQLLSYFRHNTVAQWRQLGFAHGHRLVTPFTTRRLASCALSVPAEARYVGGAGSFTPKHLLKSLLGRRLPSYPVRQPKGSGSLPVGRYFESGPLADVFDRYEPPAFVPDSLYSDHVERFGPVTWNLITFAVWRDRVLDDPDLSRMAGTRVVEA
jgi:asparagine synthase (glutamine-hydrolysing)